MISRTWAILGLLLLVLFLPGCFTVLKHPEGVTLVDEYQNRKSCMDCHQETWLYHYDPYWYGSYYPGDWRYYYGRPWWYDDYWYYTPPGQSEPVERGGRHMWTQPGLSVPQLPGGGPALMGQENKSKQQSSGTQPAPESKKETQKKEEKDTKRHMWTK